MEFMILHELTKILLEEKIKRPTGHTSRRQGKYIKPPSLVISERRNIENPDQK